MVKERQTTTDTMFEPLSKIIDMLRSYGVVIPEESLVQLQELPDKWANTKRLSVMAIQQVPLAYVHLYCDIDADSQNDNKLRYQLEKCSVIFTAVSNCSVRTSFDW